MCMRGACILLACNPFVRAFCTVEREETCSIVQSPAAAPCCAVTNKLSSIESCAKPVCGVDEVHPC
jgi:hypothetical protein